MSIDNIIGLLGIGLWVVLLPIAAVLLMRRLSRKRPPATTGGSPLSMAAAVIFAILVSITIQSIIIYSLGGGFLIYVLASGGLGIAFLVFAIVFITSLIALVTRKKFPLFARVLYGAMFLILFLEILSLLSLKGMFK